MAKFPLEVEVNEETIKKATVIFRKAQKEIAKEIESATDFGVANRKALLKQIDEILKALAVEAGELTGEEIPKYYKKGANDAVSQLDRIDAEVKVRSGFNRIHRQAIEALVDDTAKSFAESITGVGRNARKLINEAVKQQITQRLAVGKIKGSDLKRIKREIVGIMREEGIASLIDKGGKKWTLDRYSEMLLRTKSVEARNKGLMNRIVENDYDLVQVSDHGSRHRECAVWEGKILSSTGRTKGYPTLQDAENAGLFHPNCKHAINVVVPELAKETNAYDFRTGKRATNTGR